MKTLILTAMLAVTAVTSAVVLTDPAEAGRGSVIIVGGSNSRGR